MRNIERRPGKSLGNGHDGVDERLVFELAARGLVPGLPLALLVPFAPWILGAPA